MTSTSFWVIYGLHWVVAVIFFFVSLLDDPAEGLKGSFVGMIKSLPRPLRKPVTMSFVFFPFIMIPLAVDLFFLAVALLICSLPFLLIAFFIASIYDAFKEAKKEF